MGTWDVAGVALDEDDTFVGQLALGENVANIDVSSSGSSRPRGLDDAVMEAHGGGNGSDVQFIVYSKNVRSVSNDDRLVELLWELTFLEWDIIVVNESWRLQRQENFDVEGGHRWLGAGGAQRQGTSGGKHGVGILVHRKWASGIMKVQATSSRILAVDIVKHELRMTIIAVYMLHSGYADSEVEAVCSDLERMRREAWVRKFRIILAGDWSAAWRGTRSSRRLRGRRSKCKSRFVCKVGGSS